MKKFFNKKTAIAAVAVVLTIALALGGTYAWQEIQQHKTNAAKGTEKVNVTLNDSYTPPANWKPGQTVDKTVSVTNLEDCSDPAYVRLQFKEYFEHFMLADVVDGDGNKLLFATYADGENIGEFMTWADAQAGGYNYEKYTVTYYDGSTADFALTNNEEVRDGIYGKPMQILTDWVKFGTADKADYPVQDHDLQKTDECDYNAYLWSGIGIQTAELSDEDVRDYISWTMGDVVYMSDWIQNPTLGDFWILDEADGWAYWANPIAPGTTTADIMKSMTLDEMAGEYFEYYLHIDMEAVSLDEMDDAFTFWFEDKVTGEPADVSDNAEKLVELFKTEPTTLGNFMFVLDTRITPEEATADLDSNFTDAIYSIGYYGNKVLLGIGDHADNDFYIDWGDGTKSAQITQAAGNLDTEREHEYAVAGEYTVALVGDVAGEICFANFTISDSGEVDDSELIIEYRLTKVLTPLPQQRPEGQMMIDGITGVTFNRDEVSYAFYYCLSLEEVPEDLFVNNPQITAMVGTFAFANLREIPAGLLTYTPNLVETVGLFGQNRSLVSIPEDLLAGCPSLVSAADMFLGCSSLTAIPENLFAGCPNIVDFSEVFNECTSLIAIPENLFANNPLAEDFRYCFGRCTLLAAIPENLFANNPLAKDFSSAFEYCTLLTTIPANLLDNNATVSDVAYMFNGCSELTLIPEWWNVSYLQAARHNSTFSGCIKASNYMDAYNNNW